MPGDRRLNAGPLLVTGASGFLGRHLLASLAHKASDRRVVVLTRDRRAWESAAWHPAVPHVEVIEGTIERPDAWASAPALAGLADIFHLAATVRHRRSTEFEHERADIDGSGEMIRLAARTHARVIAVSTSGTVGCSTDPDARPDEEAPWCHDAVAQWPYYRGKIEAERVTRELADALGVTLVTLRPPVLLGPGDYRGRSTGHVLRFLRGRLPFIVPGGMHFVDVRDVADALVAAMRHPSPRPVYHLPGHASTIPEFFREVGVAAGRKPPRIVLPVRLAWWMATLFHPLHLLPEPTAVEMASRYWGLSTRYAEVDLGHHPRAARETLGDTVRWLRETGPR